MLISNPRSLGSHITRLDKESVLVYDRLHSSQVRQANGIFVPGDPVEGGTHTHVIVRGVVWKHYQLISGPLKEGMCVTLYVVGSHLLFIILLLIPFYLKILINSLFHGFDSFSEPMALKFYCAEVV